MLWKLLFIFALLLHRPLVVQKEKRNNEPPGEGATRSLQSYTFRDFGQCSIGWLVRLHCVSYQQYKLTLDQESWVPCLEEIWSSPCNFRQVFVNICQQFDPCKVWIQPCISDDFKVLILSSLPLSNRNITMQLFNNNVR